MSSFNQLGNLQSLILCGNPLLVITDSDPQISKAKNLRYLDLSFTGSSYYDADDFASFTNLVHLDLSYSNVSVISIQGFKSTPLLEILTLKNAPLEFFPSDLLKKLNNLKTISSSNYRLCCEKILPDKFDTSNCHTQRDVLSSCEDLLRSDMYRLSLWLLAFLAIIGKYVNSKTFHLQ